MGLLTRVVVSDSPSDGHDRFNCTLADGDAFLHSILSPVKQSQGLGFEAAPAEMNDTVPDPLLPVPPHSCVCVCVCP